MAPDNALVGRVRAALKRTVHVEEKKMFGGIVFMVGGKMCVSVGRDRLMCRIDPSRHDAALERTGCRTVVMKGRRYHGYVYVDRSAVRIKRDLERWIGLALDYNRAARPSKRGDRART
jgi:TfoX/Sxy family transcriptional regulator of competence genes